MTIAYPNEIYSTFAFIGMVLAFIPLPWHLQAWNTGTCLYMIWAGLACLNAFVNSIVWKQSVLNVAPVWCDISARFFLGLNVAIPACTLCINRRLYHIASVKTVTISRTEKRRGVMIDLAIGLGIPVFQMIISYIPQGHRFNILEDVGCFPAIYVTPVGFCLVTIWPLMISIVSSVYSFLSIRAFYKTRAQLSAILSNHKNCNTSRYTRLMILAFVETACTLPLTIYVVAATASAGIAPWLGWADTHYNFSRVVQIAGVIWRGAEGSQVESTRWFSILPPYIFFCFFGFAEEAIKNYRSAIQSISKHTGISTMTWGNFGSGSFGSSKGSTTEVDSSGGVLPVYVKRDVHSKRDTMDSFSDMTTSISDGASFDEKIHGEKDGVPDYENIVLPVAGGTLTDLKLDEHTPSTSSNSSTTSLPRLTVPAPHAARPDSSIIEISSIKDDSAIKVSDKESRV